LQKDLFHSETWKVLGLTQLQLSAIAAASGGIAGAALDIAAAGISFGIFTGIGSALGAGAALIMGKRVAKVKISGSRLTGFEMTIGPSTNPQFPFILLDRVFLFYSYVINWAHGRRDYPNGAAPDLKIPNPTGDDSSFKKSELFEKTDKMGRVSAWSPQKKQLYQAFISLIHRGDIVKLDFARKQLIPVLIDELQNISNK